MSRRQTVEAVEQFKEMFIRSTERGTDGYGVAYMIPDGKVRYYRDAWNAAQVTCGMNSKQFNDLSGWLIGNCRALPTTEFFGDRKAKLQPYVSGDWHVIHNGTIANDKELREEYSLEVDTDIDSAVIPALLKERFGDTCCSWQEVVRYLRKILKGSYALGITTSLDPNEILLMCNYKPIFIAQHRRNKHVLFSSLPEYIEQFSRNNFLMEYEIHQLPPYSSALLRATRTRCEVVPVDLVQGNLDKTFYQKKALVVCSGGMDSTVAATIMKRSGLDITLAHFQYRCRAEQKELEAVKAIAEYLKCDYVTIPTDIFRDVIGGSTLMENSSAEIVQGDAGAEYAHEWVPARNLIMLSIATGYAEAHGYRYIGLGTNLEESGAYPDNEMIFIRKLNEVLPYAVNEGIFVEIEMPVGHMMKHNIVRHGTEIGAPLHLTWSCYHGRDKHCGVCGPCTMRRKAYQIALIEDPMKYETDQDEVSE